VKHKITLSQYMYSLHKTWVSPCPTSQCHHLRAGHAPGQINWLEVFLILY